MKVENKSVLIVDPCYFTDDEEWGGDFDYTTNEIINPNITDYIWDNTGFGDGSFEVLEVVGNVASKEELIDYIEDYEDASYNFFEDATRENLKKLDALQIHQRKIGDFGVDSGTFGVFLYDEIKRNWTDFFRTHKSNKGIFSVINNFDGIIEVYEDERNQKHIIGVGNISFFTNSKNY